MITTLDQQMMRLKPGDHVCPLHESPAQRIAVATTFVKQSLERGERCIYAGDQAVVDEVAHAVAAAGVDVDRQSAIGALQFLTDEETYLRTGEFVPSAMIDYLSLAETSALADGYTGLRYIGEMGWSPQRRIDPGRLIEYEALVNDFTARGKSTVLCQYDLQRFELSVIHDILRTHPIAMVGDNRLSPNPYYEPPELILSGDRLAPDEFKARRVSRWMSRISEASAADSERDRTTNELRDQEQHIRLLLNSAAEAIYGVDTNLNCTFANAACARLLGHDDPSVLEGQNMHRLTHHTKPDGSPFPEEECPISQAIETGRDAHGEDEVFWRADGSTFPVEYWSHLVRRDGEAIGAVVSFLDISNRRALEEELRQAQKMEAIGKLAGGIAHDFNNLLLVIRTCSAFLMAGIKDAPLREDVSRIEGAVARAAELTHQLLAFSSQQALDLEPINVNAIVEETHALLVRSIGEDIEMVSEFAPGLHPIFADRGQLSQVILNLAVNARDAMPDGGALTIRTANAELGDRDSSDDADVEPGSYVVLEVSDSGIGMDAETRSRVFDPFYTTKDEGTGLGLATVYGIVKQNGGYIQVDSKLGEGTTFKIHFPITEAMPAAAPSKRKRDSQRGSETILLVEDEAQLRPLIARVLTSHGYVILEAGNGADALDLLEGRSEQIDLLLTDVVMPGINGAELAERVIESHPNVKVIFSSGYPGGADVRTKIAGVQTASIDKPYLIEELTEKVRAVLDS